jgi:hypothetical protein
VESRYLQGCSPRLSQLRTDGLAPRASFEHTEHMLVFMGPISLVVGCQQKLDFSPLLHWLLWERSWVRTHGSISRYAVDYVRSPYSRGQWICSNLLTTVRKVAICGPREIRMVLDHMWTEREKRVAC